MVRPFSSTRRRRLNLGLRRPNLVRQQLNLGRRLLNLGQPQLDTGRRRLIGWAAAKL